MSKNEETVNILRELATQIEKGKITKLVLGAWNGTSTIEVFYAEGPNGVLIDTGAEDHSRRPRLEIVR